jgi:methylmalonyl-CoA mutase N-terminal domain/subunit
MIPLFVTCVENDMTLGEICGVLRKVWGEYQPPVWG